MKYIRIDKSCSGTVSLDNFIVLFPDDVNHDEMASNFKDWTIVSAGFAKIDLECGYVSCYGESFTLGLRSLKEDTQLLRMQVMV